MSFGNQTIVFKRMVKTGTFDEQGNAQVTETSVSAPGCRHRPLTFQEIVDGQFDVATQPWRSTLPLKDYDAALLAAIGATKPQDSIWVDNVRYQIVGGVRPFPDLASVPFKMTIISQRFDG